MLSRNLEQVGFRLNELPKENKDALINGIAREFIGLVNRNAHHKITGIIEGQTHEFMPGDQLRITYKLNADFASVSLAINMMEAADGWVAAERIPERECMVLPILTLAEEGG